METQAAPAWYGPWYGPHQCAECGVMIVKAARESGAAEFEPPDVLMRVFLRGAESGNPEVVYPITWTPHVHRVNGSAASPAPPKASK